MALTFKLEIMTPDRIFFSDNVEMVIVTTPQGELGVLAGHMPLVAAIAVGSGRIKKENGEWVEAVLTEGFMEVKQDKVVIIADAAEWPYEIDANRAEAAKKRAEERLAQKKSEEENARNHAAIARAMARLKATSKFIKG